MSVPQDISTSWGDCLVPSSSSGRAGSSARLPSLLPGPAYEATLPVLQGATGHPNPTLEVQATRGVCLGCAKEIYHKTRHLRHAVNVNGDTPLHCAARAGNLRMICHLVTLAAEEASYGGGNGREAAEAVLRRHNRRGDTALHEAIRSGGTKLARLLLWVDAQLPRVPGEGTSPLYLAVSLGREDFVRLLLRCESQANLSYSGPDGQNALHAAVLRGSADTTCMLLCLNKDLIKQRDRYGSTPLHFAASVEAGLYAPSILSFSYIWDSQLDMDLALDKFRFSALRGPITALLNEDSSSAYLPDNDGLLPVHVAASAGKIKVLHILLGKCPDSAGMRDAKGRTFLHVAVEKKRHNIVAFACQDPEVAWVLNMQDNDGNTAIHLAVRVGDLRNFCSLMKNRKVRLNVRNNNEQTPLDVSCCGKTRGLSYGMDPRISIHRLLIYAHAQNGNFRWDQFENEHIPTLDEENEGRKITESMQALGIGAVLVATATFAAAFTMPGGYRADDHTNGGAPTRAGRYSFDAFVIANALAFTLSCLATTLLVLSGAAAVNIGTRLASLSFSVAFLLSAARSFCVAFALGLYVVLSPVALPTAIAACVITSFTLLDATLFVRVMFTEVKTLHCRQGISAWWLLGRMIILNMLSEFWSYIVIFSLPAILKIHRN